MVTEQVDKGKTDPRDALIAEAQELGVLVCEVPIKTGPNKGKSARGTLTGFTRHRKVGESAEEMDADCREFRNSYVRSWDKDRRAALSERVIHAVLSDGAEVVRYRTSKKWYIEKGENRQKVTVAQAAEAIKNDAEVDYRSGLDGSAGLEKLLPERLVA